MVVLRANSAWQRRRASRPLPKLHTDRQTFEVVPHLLGKRWSTERIAPTLAALDPKDRGYRVSTETIYNSIHAHLMGGPKRELVVCPRHAHTKRVPAAKGRTAEARAGTC